MNPNLHSHFEFLCLKDRINKEIKRRGTYSWWNPLVPPSIGSDRTPSVTIPNIGIQMALSDKTYTINTSSDGSLEPTRNIRFKEHGESPAGPLIDPFSFRYYEDKFVPNNPPETIISNRLIWVIDTNLIDGYID